MRLRKCVRSAVQIPGGVVRNAQLVPIDGAVRLQLRGGQQCCSAGGRVLQLQQHRPERCVPGGKLRHRQRYRPQAGQRCAVAAFCQPLLAFSKHSAKLCINGLERRILCPLECRQRVVFQIYVHGLSHLFPGLLYVRQVLPKRHMKGNVFAQRCKAAANFCIENHTGAAYSAHREGGGRQHCVCNGCHQRQLRITGEFCAQLLQGLWLKRCVGRQQHNGRCVGVADELIEQLGKRRCAAGCAGRCSRGLQVQRAARAHGVQLQAARRMAAERSTGERRAGWLRHKDCGQGARRRLKAHHRPRAQRLQARLHLRHHMPPCKLRHDCCARRGCLGLRRAAVLIHRAHQRCGCRHIRLMQERHAGRLQVFNALHRKILARCRYQISRVGVAEVQRRTGSGHNHGQAARHRFRNWQAKALAAGGVHQAVRRCVQAGQFSGLQVVVYIQDARRQWVSLQRANALRPLEAFIKRQVFNYEAHIICARESLLICRQQNVRPFAPDGAAHKQKLERVWSQLRIRSGPGVQVQRRCVRVKAIHIHAVGHNGNALCGHATGDVALAQVVAWHPHFIHCSAHLLNPLLWQAAKLPRLDHHPMARGRRCKAGRILVAHMHVRGAGERLVDARHKRLHARVCSRCKNMRLVWNDGELNCIVGC